MQLKMIVSNYVRGQIIAYFNQSFSQPMIVRALKARNIHPNQSTVSRVIRDRENSNAKW